MRVRLSGVKPRLLAPWSKVCRFRPDLTFHTRVVLSRLPVHRREDLMKAELYPEDSAGRVMTTSLVALDEKMTAQEAIDSIRALGEDDE